VWIIPPTLVGVFGLIALPDRVMIVCVYPIPIFYSIVYAAPQNPRPVRTNPAHIKIKLTKNNSVLEKITAYLMTTPHPAHLRFKRWLW
jgi:hypothetical protein